MANKNCGGRSMRCTIHALSKEEIETIIEDYKSGMGIKATQHKNAVSHQVLKRIIIKEANLTWQWTLQKKKRPEKKQREKCAADGCYNIAGLKGLCPNHNPHNKPKENKPRKKKEKGNCTVRGCEKILRAKGLCHNHYFNNYYYETLERPVSRRKTKTVPEAGIVVTRETLASIDWKQTPSNTSVNSTPRKQESNLDDFAFLDKYDSNNFLITHTTLFNLTRDTGTTQLRNLFFTLKDTGYITDFQFTKDGQVTIVTNKGVEIAHLLKESSAIEGVGSLC